MNPTTSKTNNSILVAYLSTEAATLPHIESNSNVIPFDDDCRCISKLLSTTDKFIYFIVSASIGKYVIPLIHDHQCIECIYVYTPDTEPKIEWLNSYPKIQGTWSVIQQLQVQLNADIISNSQQHVFQPFIWNSLFSTIYSQDPNTKSTVYHLKNKKPRCIWEATVIAKLQCPDLVLSCPNSRTLVFKNFDDVTSCSRFISEEKRTVLLIVSDSSLSLPDLERMYQIKTLQAMYIWSRTCTIHSSSSENRVVHGIFTDIDNLRQRLIDDICFYRQAKLRSFPFVTYKSIDMDRFILPQLDEKQNQFLSIYFLSNIFSEIPESSNVSIGSEDNAREAIKYLSRLVNKFDISELLPDLLNLRRRISKLYDSQFVSPQCVYRADVLSSEDLHILRKNYNCIFMSNTYMLTTKSLLTARTISRNIAGTGLNAAVFKIEITKNTRLFDLREDNCILFPFGSTFRICSIDQAPDGVWYVKLNCNIDHELEVVIQQLQYEVDQSLSWLTFGRFLCALKFMNEAKEYYKICLRTLADDPSDASVIHHHLGILHASNKEDLRAYFHMRKALRFPQPTIQEVLHRGQSSVNEETHDSSVDQSIILGNIADINHKMGRHEAALDFYEKALATIGDQKYRRQYQYKRNILKNMLRPHS